MKQLLLLALCLFGYAGYAQNTFPSSGNVAIGTAPVNGVSLMVNGLVRNINGSLQIQDPDSAPSGSWISLTSPRSAPGIALAEGDGNGNIARRWDTYVKGGSYHIADNNFSTTQSRLTITTAGNVGIGTASPSNLLEVNGTIRSKEIRVESANWPDYVFDDNYQMQSLAEIESFVKKNKHLPGIPIQKEVEEDGVSLGEINRKLLEKVEELTLHLIEKEKVIEKQNSVLANVLQRLNKLEEMQN